MRATAWREGAMAMGDGLAVGAFVAGPVQFEAPLWLVLAPALGAAAWWMGRRSLAGLGGGVRWTALSLRLLVILTVTGALAEPSLRDESEAIAVTVVLDDSRSIPVSERSAVERYIAELRAENSGRNLELGVITVARTAFVQDLPSPNIPGIDRKFTGPTDASDLASGLRLAVAVAPPDAANRLLLISDGNETAGSILSAADAALAAGIPVDVLPVRYQNEAEVVLDSLVAPPNVRGGESVALSVIATATAPAAGRLSITADGQPVDLDPDMPGNGVVVRLDEGKNRLTVTVRPDRPGPQLYEAVFEPIGAIGADEELLATGEVGDTVIENNRASAVTFVGGEGWVMLVGDSDEETRYVESVLVSAGVRVRGLSPGDVPADITRLNEYDAIVLMNQAADRYSLAQQEAMRQYVYDSGGGLLMTGGPDAFGAGGWIGSPLEDALPVRLDPPQKRQMPRGALALVIHSCEAPRGVFWGKQACIAAVEALSSRDLVGIIEFQGWGGQTDWVHQMQPVGDRSAVNRAINNLQFGDMQNFGPSLSLALNGLTAVDAGQRHCIVISDGDPSLNTAQVQQFADAGITISAIGVFPHSPSDTNTLQRMARMTNGTYYGINTQGGLAQIPQIFIKEARTVRRALIWEGEPFSPAVTGAPVEAMRGISSVPPIAGYVVVAEREGLAVTTMRAVRQELLGGELQTVEDPIAAQWQYGLGKVAVFTSDATTRWGAAWVGWEGFRQFWAQHVRWVMRAAGSPNVRTTYEQDGDRTIILIDALDEDGERLNFAQFDARLAKPGGDGEAVTIQQIAPGRYRAEVATADAGTYVLTAQYRAAVAGDGGGPDRVMEGTVQTAVTRPFADEFRALDTNLPVLTQVAEITGGRVLERDPSADEPWRREGLERPVSLSSIWWTVAVIGVGLFIADVGVRRVRLDPRAVVSFVGKTFRGGSADLAAKEGQLGALRAARETARSRMAGGEGGEDDRAARKRRAATKFEAADESAAVAGPVALSGEQEKPAIPELRKPAVPAAKKQEEEESGMSRLMKAKREAREKFGDDA